jgi:predicted nucleotidyltransferase
MTPDPRALLETLARHDVDFVVIGGVAVQAYGHLRTTRDVDVIAAPTPENGLRLAAALTELHAVNRGVDARHLHDPTDPATFAQAGSLFLDTRDGMLDVMQDAAGAPPYADLRERAVAVRLGAIEVQVAGLDDLISLKRAAGRPVDQEDIAVLTDLQRIARDREADLDEVRAADPVDPAIVLLGQRPAKARLARVWDGAAELVYVYRDEFGRPVELDPAQPIGPRPPAGTRQRRVWDRLVGLVEAARERIGISPDDVPGEFGEDLRSNSHP